MSHDAPPAAVAPGQLWWEQVQAAYQAQDWPLLEGSLRRLLQLVEPQASLWDLLGHALLQQGRSQAAIEALQRALDLGSSHFWTPHKLGDARRGLQQPQAAVEAYELALQWGSDSPLTPRNLLEVLHLIDPQLALQRLMDFAAAAVAVDALPWDQPPPWLRGAMAAALLVQGSELAQWLCSHGCRQADVRGLLLRDAAYRLDIDRFGALLADPCDPREVALAERLRDLSC